MVYNYSSNTQLKVSLKILYSKMSPSLPLHLNVRLSPSTGQASLHCCPPLTAGRFQPCTVLLALYTYPPLFPLGFLPSFSQRIRIWLAYGDLIAEQYSFPSSIWIPGRLNRNLHSGKLLLDLFPTETAVNLAVLLACNC